LTYAYNNFNCDTITIKQRAFCQIRLHFRTIKFEAGPVGSRVRESKTNNVRKIKIVRKRLASHPDLFSYCLRIEIELRNRFAQYIVQL